VKREAEAAAYARAEERAKVRLAGKKRNHELMNNEMMSNELTIIESIQDAHYWVVKTHRMPYLHRSFSAKEPNN